MAQPTTSITSLAFLTPGNFADDDPYPGLEDTLHLIAPELGWQPSQSTMSSEILDKAIPLYQHP